MPNSSATEEPESNRKHIPDSEFRRRNFCLIPRQVACCWKPKTSPLPNLDDVTPFFWKIRLPTGSSSFLLLLSLSICSYAYFRMNEWKNEWMKMYDVCMMYVCMYIYISLSLCLSFSLEISHPAFLWVIINMWENETLA
jgi:hypothetical protein